MSEKGDFLRELYAHHPRGNDETRISIRRTGYIVINRDGYIIHVRVRFDKRGQGWADKLIACVKRAYGDILHSHAESTEDENLLRKHAITILPNTQGGETLC
jgi:hypothetical protein